MCQEFTQIMEIRIHGETFLNMSACIYFLKSQELILEIVIPIRICSVFFPQINAKSTLE